MHNTSRREPFFSSAKSWISYVFFVGIYFTIIRVYPRLAIEYVYSKETGGKEDESAGKKTAFLGVVGYLRGEGRIKEIPGNCPRNANEEDVMTADVVIGQKRVLGQKMFPKRGLKQLILKITFWVKIHFLKNTIKEPFIMGKNY